MKIGIFGCGYIYDQYKSLIPDEHELIVLIDNSEEKHGTCVDGCVVIYPRELHKYDVDSVILMSNAFWDMRTQLIQEGLSDRKIIHYLDFMGMVSDKTTIYPSSRICNATKTLLILTSHLGFHGGAVAILRAAIVASDNGYRVTVASPCGDNNFIKTLSEKGIEVIIRDYLEYASEDKLHWILEYDEIIVNTFPMVRCAIKLSKSRKVKLWLHESPEIYNDLEYWHEEIQEGILNENLKLYAVSNRARRNFLLRYCYSESISILPVVIEDWYVEKNKRYDSKIRLAVIANIAYNKGQDVVLRACENILCNQEVEWVFIGRASNDEYAQTIRSRINRSERCVFLGEKTTEEMRTQYNDIDIVIVPSREETFSMVAAEAMMMGKICIVSDHCGISEYIKHGENGFVFRSEDYTELSDIIMWCLRNDEIFNVIGENARRTYESSFNMDIVKRMLLDSIEE